MTSQQDALYRAVCEYPDEDTPRLIFADCVEESGDGLRAALIRTQIELARVPEHDPLWSRCRRHDPNAILGLSLSYPLPNLPAGFSWFGHRMKRGFSWQASLGAECFFFRHAAELFAAAPIQALDLSDCSDLHKKLPRLIKHRDFSRLRRLEFAGSSFKEREALILGSASQITELHLAYHAITAEGLQALAGTPLAARLSDLELEGAELPPPLIIDALAAAGPGQLRKLAVHDSQLAAADAARLVVIPWLQTVETLDLSENPLHGGGTQAVAKSRELAGLEILKLARTFPGVSGVKALAATPNLKKLRWLDLARNRLGPVAVRILAGSKLLSRLRVLDLSDNPIGDAGVIALAGAEVPELRELVLANCAIADRGAAALAESPSLDGLLCLDLRDRPPPARPFHPAIQGKLIRRFGSRVKLPGNR